jgi:type VI secretion system protein ImpI
MFISLSIDNVDKLPDGGPLNYKSYGRGFEIGRENRDWTLADPDKFISGRHCEVRFEAGAFWLHDVSRNGTFVNGSSQRITHPHRLSHGDRLRIGRYLVSVSIGNDPPGRSAPGTTANAGRASSPMSKFGERPSFEFAHSSVARSSDQERSERAASSFSFERDPFLAPEESTSQQRSPQQRAPAPPSQIAAPSAAPSNQFVKADEILGNIAAGAGVPPEAFLQRDPREVATEIGAVLRTVTDELALLLKARAAAKALAKSGHRTMISAADNNPLKFVPGSEDILEIMFGRRKAGYLDAKHSVEEAFRDLKSHEFATYAAMQAALSRLLDDLSPDAIEKKLPASSFASKKGRAWETFVATWEAKEGAHENGMLDVFLAYFAEAYAKAAKQK